MTPQELQANLAQFTGTEGYTRWSRHIFPNFVLTDGAKYLAENAGAYWLMDAIASHFASYKNEGFVVAKFMAIVGGWELNLTDGNENRLATQLIEYSDFPLDEITLYVIPQDMGSETVWVIMLTSEY